MKPDRRTRHEPCKGASYPDRRKSLWDRRDRFGHRKWMPRLLFIPLGRLFLEFRTVTIH